MKIPNTRLTITLKQQLLPIYLITGDEPLLVEEACEAIDHKANAEGIHEHKRWQANQNFDWQLILDEANSLSLFDDSTILTLSLTSNTVPDTGKEVLESYCDNPPEKKILILKANKLDPRSLNSKWCKEIEKKGCIVQCWPLPIDQLPDWVNQRLQQQGLTATPEAIQFIAEQVEGNLLAAKQEIEKLKLIYDNKFLQLDDVVSAMSDNARYDIFKLADCALSGDTKRTLRIIQSLKAEKCEPTLILWTLAREIRTLISLQTHLEKHEPLDGVLQKFGVWEKRKPIMKAALKRLKLSLLLKLLKQASEVDRMIKGVAEGNVWDKLFFICLRLSS